MGPQLPDNPIAGIEAQRRSVLHRLRDQKITVVTEGLVIIGNRTVKIRSVLHDTGASDHNYISPSIFEILQPMLSPGQERKINGGVTLGDGVTKMAIDTEVKLMVRFWDPGGMSYQAEVWFQVFKTGHDMIIGYPAIVDHFLDLLICLLRHGKQERAGREELNYFDALSVLVDLGDEAPRSSDLIPAWSTSLEDAEEESDLFDPVLFDDALHFLTISKEEAYTEFVDLLATHISKEFAAATPVKELLLGRHLKRWIPDNWEGIKVEPIELQWDETRLAGYRSNLKTRHINPRLREAAYKEHQRLTTYHLVPSQSPVASPMVHAPKATPPYIRTCGDYVEVNKFVITHHGYIPIVEYELHKIIAFKYFMDIDMTTAFHQMPLARKTSERLSIVTPWGQFRPVFMPEGVAPASIILQDVMRSIFSDFSDWSIIIFDNILLLAHNYQDAYDKLDKFLQRCEERNIVLKMSKSWLGFLEVKFFGYEVRHDSYQLGDERKGVIERIVFPKSVKETQSFLGLGIFFQRFVPQYATTVAPLYEMTKQKFVWDPKTWKVDYVKVFESAKQAILNSLRLYFPDYKLRWIMRTDASNYGVGGVLLQVKVEQDGSEILQPIAFVSKKFSERAAEWATIQQECYGIYFTLQKLQHYVRGKSFELETDHANLQWMESSENPAIIRMRVFVQGFIRFLRHIPGSHNKVADYFSRTELSTLWNLFLREEVSELTGLLELSIDELGDEYDLERIFCMLQLAVFQTSGDLQELAGDQQASEKIESACIVAHNARRGHFGARRTWLELNRLFPGHGIPFAVVQEFIMACPICQKDRLRIANSIPPIYRTIKTEHLRRAIGIDHVTITPADEDGNDVATVLVNLFSGRMDYFPRVGTAAQGTCEAIFMYMCEHGLVEEIHSDPGSDLKSTLLTYLNKYLGTEHVFSLVDRHESNGVERVIQEVLRHLRALVYEERVIDKWSKPIYRAAIKYIMNNAPLSERGGYTANQLTYGTADQSYYMLRDLTKQDNGETQWPTLIKQLDESIATVRAASKKYQEELIAKRAENTPEVPNSFQPGDFITLLLVGMRDSKLTPRYKGPYEVIRQYKNDIECRHMSMGNIEVLNVEGVQLFIGSRGQAEAAARLDADEYVVVDIKAYRGDPLVRTTMQFLVRFSDGDEIWLYFSNKKSNISRTVVFEEYCRSKPELYILILSDKDAKKHIQETNKRRINTLEPGDIFYLDIRTYGYQWYNNLQLPESDFRTYVVKCSVQTWEIIGYKLYIVDEILRTEFTYRNFDVISYGYRRTIAEGDTLIDADWVIRYPQLLRR
jgi:hypothetical protein